jgi:hypothetical protein
VVYIVLFTFLEGYTFIFTDTYGVSQGITNVAWAGMLCGILLVTGIVPLVYSWTAKEYQKTSTIVPETRLWYAMLGGAPAVPISLFWMGWTANVSFPNLEIRTSLTLPKVIYLDLVSTHCFGSLWIWHHHHFHCCLYVCH